MVKRYFCSTAKYRFDRQVFRFQSIRGVTTLMPRLNRPPPRPVTQCRHPQDDEVCQGCHLRPVSQLRGKWKGPFLASPKSPKSRGLYLVYFPLIEKTNEIPGAPSYYLSLNYSASSSQTTNKDATWEKARAQAGFDLLSSLFWDFAFQEGTDVYYFFIRVYFWQSFLLLWLSCLFSSAVCLNSTY